MPGPSPNPNARRRNAPTIAWTTLPSEGKPAPSLPRFRQWQAPTKAWWKALWAKPQAHMWESDGSTLWVLAEIRDDVFAGRTEIARVSAEIRQHEDRHGLSPRAMIQLRWRFAGVDAEVERQDVSEGPGSVVSLDRRRRGA